MVGIFHLGNKESPSRSGKSTDSSRPTTPPPPPYAHGAHDAPVFATTTTTRVVTTTTQTTTHFFSLPLWRRRAQQPAACSTGAGAERETLRGSADELGVVRTTPMVYLRDKDLPPTPPAEEVDLQSPVSSRDRQGSPHSSQESRRVAPNLPPDSSSSLPEPSPVPSRSSESNLQTPASTSALARAALGLGLPPLNLNSSLTPGEPSATDVSSVSFVAPSLLPSPPINRVSQSTMRRAKSFQRVPNDGADVSHGEVRERRRTRGLSLGPLHFGSDDKADAKDTKEVPERKSLSRKSSFWSRKRHDSRTPAPPPAPPLPEQFAHRPSLPSLMPVSPFYIDTRPSDQPSVNLEEPSNNLQANLRRRHSERAPSQIGKSPPASPEPSSPQSPRRTKRPQTADSVGSPRAMSSFFPGTPPNLTSSPHPDFTPGRNDTAAPAPVPQVAFLRPRSQTNPPFLHRLSMNLFGSSPTPSPVNGSVDPFTRSPRTSLSSSSRPSVSRQSPKVSVEIPRPRHEEESPEVYLHRLCEAVSKAEVATVLASSADDFHAAALRAYIDRFDFNGDPLDVALRRLLMDVGLPRETQQIDRVIEAFAARYRNCHPGLYTSEDQPYILAFSLIMLHTDAFNKSNKRKMTKADYIKNTRLPGVPPEVLDCFYDNIIFAPFIFIEDPLDVNGQRNLLPEAASARRLSTLNVPSPGGLSPSTSTLLSKNTKIDPYYLITRNLLDDLRVDVQSYVPATSPYSYQGTAGPWDDEKLLEAFAMANTIEIVNENKYMTSSWFGLNVGGGPNTHMMASTPVFVPPGPDVASLKVTRVGLMLRKEGLIDGGRKANNRKWREWSVLLTGSQLLWSRDPAWSGIVQTHIQSARSQVSVSHQGTVPKPDELLSVKDAVAVYDRSYNKYQNTFRLVMPDGRYYLLQVKTEDEMNGWIACINYASAFKTAGVRMRSPGMSGRDIELTGQAAAVSHLRDMQLRPTMSPPVRSYGSSAEQGTPPRDGQYASDSTSVTESSNDEPVTPPMDNGSRLFKATFDKVKADLAAGKWQPADAISLQSIGRPRAYSLESTLQTPTSPTSRIVDGNETLRLSSRSQIIKSKVQDLESRISAQQTQLDTDLRFVRNVAVLTPFQRSTRDRLQAAVQNVSKRVMQVRLEMEKLTCHRDVLSKDLCAEQRDWQRTTKMALRAATEKLHLERQTSLPRMTLSTYLDDTDVMAASPISIPRSANRDESSQQRPESSAAESFHSALEYSSDWTAYSPSDDRGRLSPNNTSSQSFDSPATTALATPQTDCSSKSSVPLPAQPPQLSAQSSLESSSAGPADGQGRGSEERFYPAPETPEEQAEEWNKTRAAKRVSLVRLPSDLKMTSFFGRHARIGSDVVSSDASTLTPSTPLHRSTSSPPIAPFMGRTLLDSSADGTLGMMDL